MNFSSLKDFFEKFKRLIVYPQYSMFLIEIFYCLCLCYFTLFRTKSHLVKLVAILIIFIVFILFYRQFNCRREINYGTFRDQLNDTRKQGEEIKKTNSILRISFLIILNIFLYGFLFGSVNKNPWMFILVFFLIVFELLLDFVAISPMLFISIFTLPLVVSSNIGITNGVLTWSLLSFILVSIGATFFDQKIYYKHTKLNIDNKKLEVELSNKKINYLIFVFFTFCALLISELITKFPIYITLEQLYNSSGKINRIISLDTLLKFFSIIFSMIFYQNSKNKIVFIIGTILLGDKINSVDDIYVLVERPSKKEKKWAISNWVYSINRVDEGFVIANLSKMSDKRQISSTNVKRLMKDVLKINKEYYVRISSDIVRDIQSKPEEKGYELLGEVFMASREIFYVIILLILAIGIFVYSENPNSINGYYVRFSSTKKCTIFDWNDIVEVKDEKIIYKGNVILLKKDDLSISDSHFSGRIEDNILEIDDLAKGKVEYFILNKSKKFDSYVDKNLDIDKTETWFDVDKDGFLEQIKVLP